MDSYLEDSLSRSQAGICTNCHGDELSCYSAVFGAIVSLGHVDELPFRQSDTRTNFHEDELSSRQVVECTNGHGANRDDGKPDQPFHFITDPFVFANFPLFHNFEFPSTHFFP